MIFDFGLLIGCYAYGIFVLGILHLLYREIIVLYSVIFILLICYIIRKAFSFKEYKKKITIFWQYIKKDKLLFFLVFLFITLVIINCIGALAPELAFDALWYHLTLPKLYILTHTIIHLQGNLIPYSDMPKLGELLYTGALALGDERLAKNTQLIAGLLCCGVIYTLTNKYTSRKYALFAVIIFYSNIVVAWESTTAYIDLIRAFFEVLALAAFLQYLETKKDKYCYYLAIFTGLAITTKLLGFGTLGIFSFLLFFMQKKDVYLRTRLSIVGKYILISLLIPLPWFIFSFIYTGNPVYPFFTSILPSSISENVLNPAYFISSIFTLFTSSSDPISPIYLIALPLLIWRYKTFSKEMKIISLYCLLGFFAWYCTPQIGGGRFILAYLPAFSILIGYLLFVFEKENKRYSAVVIITILFLVITTILYRGAASVRYVPVVFGFESKSQFLTQNLNFSFGDFYDTDGYFEKHITSKDTVLLYGFHNLYYIDFPFIDSSWIKTGQRFNYIALQGEGSLPIRFSEWKKIYTNPISHIQLYSRDNLYIAY